MNPSRVDKAFPQPDAQMIFTPKRIAIAPGDPAGIGYEITAKALEKGREILKNGIVVVYAQRDLWNLAVQRFAPTLHTRPIASIDEAVDLEPVYLIDPDPAFSIQDFKQGQIQAQCARCAHNALMKIVADVRAKRIDGICTGPIHKGAMRLAGIDEIGHTEMLAKGLNATNPMTLFITRDLRIFFYSRHLSLRQAIEALDVDKLIDFGLQMNQHMKTLGFDKPRLAMAALNPHASDGGQFGHEEEQILAPAVQALRQRDIDMSGPIGADTVFAQAANATYDAVLSLYHDQGHIAAKTYDFERTISATLGLPCLRTSVDHGTAFDIAWQGTAQFISMQTALEVLVKSIKG